MEERLVDIPPLFRKADTELPLAECLMCKRDLLQPGVHYMIEKSIRNYRELGTQEVIFEYAMCMDCAMEMRMELSEESRRNIENYFMAHIQPGARQATAGEDGQYDFHKLISNCIVKNSPINDSHEYAVYAHCIGNKLAISEMPYALSGEAMDEMMQLLSNKTLDILDDFIGEHFSGPPELREILRRRPVFI